MNDNTLQEMFIDKGCFPHQAQFAANFFAPDAARRHILVSSPGMGKRFAAAVIVNHAMSSGLAHRVLVLAPAALLAQWQEMVRRGDQAAPVMIVDRRRLRELEDSRPVGEEIWPANAILILSFDFAKQTDVAGALGRCPWDLLVVDQVQLAPRHSPRRRLLFDLIVGSSQARVLFLRPGGPRRMTEADTSAELFRAADAALTVWTPKTLRDHQGKSLLPEVRMEWINYRRQPEEAEVLSRLQDSLRSLDTTNATLRLAAATLMQSASSSFFALEQRLRRIRQRRNELAHGIGEKEEAGPDAEEVGMDAIEVIDIGDQLRRYAELERIAEPLLSLLEELATDSKADALVQLLDSSGARVSPDRRVCVFTRFVDTATYLENVLREAHPLVRGLTGGHSLAERERVIADFAHTGGVLIATEAVATTIPEVATAVFYDLPLNPAVLEARIGQFVRVGRHGPVQIVAFADESNTFVIERLQRKVAEIKEALGEQEIEQVLFPKDRE
jgi:superfamily II DNA or RNA helicase